MARGRMISKTISLDEKVDSLSSDTVRLLFTWLITHLDCEGRMYGDAQTVKSIVFPRRPMKAQTIEKYLVELEQKGLILRYSAPGGNPSSAPNGVYLSAPNFEKHQVGLRKTQESASQIPPFTTELKRSESVLAPTQTKTKVEIKTKEETKEESVSLSIENVYEVYKKEIMPDESVSIPEDMEEELRDATRRFTASWVVDAIREGVRRKAKSWRYITTILSNWQREEDAGFPRSRAKGQGPGKHRKSELSTAEVNQLNAERIAAHNAAKKLR